MLQAAGDGCGVGKTGKYWNVWGLGGVVGYYIIYIIIYNYIIMGIRWE